jgi:hypothetical protein
MNINHHNYESILIDYSDGNLSDAERIDVELFLLENPEIAEQFSDFADVVLVSDEKIVFNKKEELNLISLPNLEFEQWENTHPKLPKNDIVFPHKHKLFKFEKRQIPQWTWYAAAACFAIIVLTINPFRHSKRSEESVGNQLVEITNYELRTAKPSTKLITKEEIMENGELRIENESLIENGKRYEVRGARYEVASPQAHPEPRTSNPEPDSEQILRFAQDDNTATIRNHIAIAVVSSINNFEILQEQTTLHLVPRHLAPDNEQIPHFIRDDNFRERLEIAFNDNVVNPLKNTIHNVVRQFYKSKTEVELFLEERDIPRYFAKN